MPPLTFNGKIPKVNSMYGIFAYISPKFLVNVGKYSIHGACGYPKIAIFEAGDTFSTISFGINFCGVPFNHPTSQENIHNSTRLSMEVSN